MKKHPTNTNSQRSSVSGSSLQSAPLATLLCMALIGCNKSMDSAPTVAAVPETKVCKAPDVLIASTLFQEVEPETQEDSDGRVSEQRVLRRRGVRVNFGVLKALLRASPGERIRLTLFNGREMDIEVEGVQKLSSENAILTGKVAGDGLSAVTLVMRNNVLVGNIHRGSSHEHYQIRYGASGLHAIQQVEHGADDDCLTMAAPSQQDAAAGPRAADDLAYIQATPVIDLLVAYTTAAKTAEGGEEAIKALIQMGIADTNKAFMDSGANASVRLMGVMEVAQSESTFSEDLTALRGKTDGKWDEVHAERARVGADQVSLVGHYTGTSVAGIGYIQASSAYAFTVTRRSAFKQFTFTHELGHNIGLQHGDGYENASGGFRTVMAYGTYTRIRRFSNPSVRYNGYMTGTASNDSVSVINANAARMAAHMSEKPSVTPIVSPPPAATAPTVPTEPSNGSDPQPCL